MQAVTLGPLWVFNGNNDREDLDFQSYLSSDFACCIPWSATRAALRRRNTGETKNRSASR